MIKQLTYTHTHKARDSRQGLTWMDWVAWIGEVQGGGAWGIKALGAICIFSAIRRDVCVSHACKISKTLSFHLWLTFKVKLLSYVRLFANPWTVAYQTPLPMEFSRQEYWSGLPFPSPGAFPDPGIRLRSPALQADTLPPEPPGKPDWSLSSTQRMIAKSELKKTWLSIEEVAQSVTEPIRKDRESFLFFSFLTLFL